MSDLPGAELKRVRSPLWKLGGHKIQGRQRPDKGFRKYEEIARFLALSREKNWGNLGSGQFYRKKFGREAEKSARICEREQLTGSPSPVPQNRVRGTLSTLVGEEEKANALLRESRS